MVQNLHGTFIAFPRYRAQMLCEIDQDLVFYHPFTTLDCIHGDQDYVGILLRGPSGSGKSDLLLRALDHGAKLVADDQVLLSKRKGQIWGSAPPSIRNRLEIRGLGLFQMKALESCQLFGLIDLLSLEESHPVESLKAKRWPDFLDSLSEEERLGSSDYDLIEDILLPRMRLCAFEASALQKLWAFAQKLSC